jgi:hypothetical protein
MSSRNKTCVSSSSVRRDDVVVQYSAAMQVQRVCMQFTIVVHCMYVWTCMYVRYIRIVLDRRRVVAVSLTAASLT